MAVAMQYGVVRMKVLEALKVHFLLIFCVKYT